MKNMAIGSLSKVQAAFVAFVLACMLSLTLSASAFAADQTVVDNSTADNWVALNYDPDEGRTTKNDGRIWTDKSVYDADATVMTGEDSTITVEKSGKSNFLVGLSALSSTMAVEGVSDKPLDIVLVLDVSGSMNEDMGYGEVYADDMTHQGTYYIKRNDDYTQLTYSYSNNSWYYKQNNRNVYVTPKESADDPNPDSIQVYRKLTKMEALSASVKAFVAVTEQMNAGITDNAKKHRISLVKFSGDISNKTGNTTYQHYASGGWHTYNHSQVVKEFAVVDGATADALDNAVDSLAPAGATRADNGMSVAEGVLKDARSNAQQVVIFFTDGVPTSFSDWDAGVANNTIRSAKNMKDNGAWVYSLGVFADADPTGDGSLGRYMNAVSSNYPSATGYTAATMGQRIPADQDYYHTAANANELQAIFDAIATEIAGKSAEVPTHVEEGYDADKGGYVTFTDQLGSYMEVSSVNSIVFNGVEYENQMSAEDFAAADASTDVFVSNETLTNSLGEEVSAGSIVATVQRSDDPRTGDTIIVKIPAALIPLAYYDVHIENSKATTTRIPTTPIRAFYEVSLKDEARQLLANPDQDMQDYLDTHTNDEGKAVFYSNAYDETQNAEIGSTVAEFVPSVVNDMYYAVEDTYIFSDAACTTPVTRINESATYYYQRVYYIEGENLAPQYELVAFPASILRNVEYDFADNGQLYVKAGTGRYTRVDAADTVKAQGANKTNTAAKAAAPRWENWNVPGSVVPVYLGNNGLLTCDVPGTLAISKKVVLPTWAKVDLDDKQFTFDVTLKTSDDKPLEGSFKAQIKDAQGKNVGNAFTLTTNDEGVAIVTLKADQTVYVYGLPDKTMYTVSESNLPDGFKQTSPADDSGQPVSAKGMVYAGKTYQAAFENTYRATGTLDGKANLKGEKDLQGRDWRDSDVFAFALAPENANNPMPANANLVDGVYMALATVSGEDSSKKFNFGDIVYTEPGTYLYDINEIIVPGTADRVLGVSYSQAVYEVTVVVTDNGDGTLKTESSMKLFGGSAAEEAKFTNVFEKEKVSFAFEGLKSLTDEAGAYQLQDGDFTFQMTAETEGAPMPEGTKDGVYTTTNKGLSVTFGSIDCGLTKEAIEEAGGTVTYEYKLVELDGGIPGMQYDQNKYLVEVNFTWDDEDGLLFTIAYPGTNKWVTFTNVFDLKDVTVELEGAKYLTGRDWKDDETFTFQLKGLDNAPMPEAAEGYSTYQFDVKRTDAQLDLGIFGMDITYDQAGTYVYELSEVRGTAGGVTYDTHVSTVTVEVTDNGEGALVAKKTVTARTDVQVEAGVSGFLNKYQSSVTYPGLTVEKTLYGRDMSFGEFDFTIEAMNPNAKAKDLATTDASFQSGAHEAGETCTMDGKLSSLKFTQEDAGKEFIYKVSEVLSKDDDAQHEGIQSNGVTYDQTEYWIVIVPVDNGNGTMHVTTKAYTDEARENLVGEWSSNKQGVPTVSFNNEYGFDDVTVDTQAEAFITKVFEGRDWMDSDTFEFVMTVAEDSADNTPLPDGAVDGKVTATVGKPANGNTAVVDLGAITFTNEGVYKYQISEAKGNLPNVEYDAHTADLTITVTDNGRGKLVASSVVTGSAFTNTYEEEVTYGDVTSLDVTKSLDGRELRAQQFSFTVKPLDIPSMRKAGMETLEGLQFRNGAPDQSGVSHMFSPDQLVFSQDDLGITYSYVFSEINEGVKGYTYDANSYTLEMTANYVDGKIQVTTKVTDQNGTVVAEEVGFSGIDPKPVVTIAFKNTYESEGAAVVVEGMKELTGRPLEKGEFEFVLAYANDPNQTPLSTVSNYAKGNVVFAEQTYNLDSLAELVEAGWATKESVDMVDTYTVNYVAFEKTPAGEGITPTVDSIAFDVVVTDKGEGTLEAQVNLPEGGLTFKNVYSTGDPIPYQVNGLKVLEAAEGLTPASIEGKFTFALTAQTEGAPMPAKAEVTNDAAGNVNFGSMEFTQDLLADVEAVDGVRTKDFVYTVTESGQVEGVTNDAETTKTFTLTLTDDGKGHLTVTANPAQGPLFSFTNVYDVEEVTESLTGEGNLTVAKKLEGRQMKDGEFAFQMFEGEELAAEGTNNAEGVVSLSAITFTEPGVHTYKLVEVQGEAGGVTYDTTAYAVQANVVDNGKGKLEVEWSIVDEGVEKIVFKNVYDHGTLVLAVSPGKYLEGRELVAGEFEFLMTAVTEGAPMPESAVAVNDAEGSVDFGEIEYSKPGTYEYTISEVAGNVEGVTYDESVYAMTVEVFDTGEGTLDCNVMFGDEEFPPVFVNYYEAPEDPENPADPSDPTPEPGKPADKADGVFAKTNDMTGLLAGVLAVVVAAAAAVVVIARRKLS